MKLSRYRLILVLMALLPCILLLVLIPMRSVSASSPIPFYLDGTEARLTLPDGSEIYGLTGDGSTHFFLPSHILSSRLDQSHSPFKLMAGDRLLEEFTPDLPINVMIEAGNGQAVPWTVSFHRSSHISSIYIDLMGMSVEEIQYGIYSPARIRVITKDGHLDYSGKSDFIKGRGNSTWDEPKNPYSIKLGEKASLLGMRPSKKWVLLANYFDGSKIRNKLVLDALQNGGMEYAAGSEWADVYLNGIYYGNYLLCEKTELTSDKLDIRDLEPVNETWVTDEEAQHREYDWGKGFEAGSSPEDISGGYLIEYTRKIYYDDHPSGFMTKDRIFSLRSPDNATLEEVTYIRSYIEELDRKFKAYRDAAEDKKPKLREELLSGIDYDSFLRRFLMEEFFYNSDAGVASYYFYKKPDDPKLYAGPGWDYDNTCGQNYIYYEGSLLDDAFLEGRDVLDWDRILFGDEASRDSLKEAFLALQPVFEDAIENKICQYEETIRDSVRMDEIRWGTVEDYHYESFENDIRFLRDFLAKRLIFLCGRWDSSTEVKPEAGNGETHAVTFESPEGSVTVPVPDFEPVPEELIPAYDEAQYSGWYPQFSNDTVSPRLPILEDTTFILK
ncbi:MAG: CotH kinase family protein [Lachnospiraceae bacterium]|nr:CotH kinase family protein [Lachnospiraceae bacterium]